MKRDTVNYVLVGGFVVLMALAFVVLLFAVTGRSGPTDTYFVYYRNVSGLKFGTGVFYEGYRVGQIERIEPVAMEEGMRYRVELSVAAGGASRPTVSPASSPRAHLGGVDSDQRGQHERDAGPGDTLTGQRPVRHVRDAQPGGERLS